VIRLEKPEEKIQIVIARPEKEQIKIALEKTGMSNKLYATPNK
jgi:hypothetical protein